MSPSASLGPRLNAIYDLLSNAQKHNFYTRIWDCCCDHGYLGIKILHENLCDKLIFVDQVAHIMQQLEAKLSPFKYEKYELITGDAAELNFDPDISHLVILAGVGGERTVQILSAIENNNPDIELDYIFCPSTSQGALREYLVSEKYALLQETLVYENKRYYEVLYVRTAFADTELPSVSLSCELWDTNDAKQKKYLQKLEKHENKKRKQSGNTD